MSVVGTHLRTLALENSIQLVFIVGNCMQYTCNSKLMHDMADKADTRCNLGAQARGSSSLTPESERQNKIRQHLQTKAAR